MRARCFHPLADGGRGGDTSDRRTLPAPGTVGFSCSLPEGRRFVTKLLPPMFPPLVDSFACFSPDERKTFERLLKKLALHIDPTFDTDASP